jgi:hypothetical protein
MDMSTKSYTKAVEYYLLPCRSLLSYSKYEGFYIVSPLAGYWIVLFGKEESVCFSIREITQLSKSIDGCH